MKKSSSLNKCMIIVNRCLLNSHRNIIVSCMVIDQVFRMIHYVTIKKIRSIVVIVLKTVTKCFSI